MMKIPRKGMPRFDAAKTRFALVYLVPSLGLFLLFYVYPYLRSFYMSFCRWSPFTGTGTFTGADNFTRLFGDAVIGNALKNNLFLLFWCTLFTFVISIFFANIFNRKKYPENGFFRSVFFIPYVLSVAVVAIMWTFLYNPSFGIINILLDKLGLSSWEKIWLGDKKVIMGAISVPIVWINTGFYMVLFYSAMSGINRELYESADVDGAGEIRKFFFITIPSIWEIIRSSLVFFIIMAFNYSFELVYVMTKGGPNRASELLTTYQYEIAFKNYDYGYSSAVGVVIFLITAAAVFMALHITKRREG
jgi:N-acetylglucosamine transport system permease protein